MHLPRALLALALPLLASACQSTGVRILAVSGHGAPIHGGYGLLSTTVDSIKSQIPGSTNYSVPFPKNDDDVKEAAVTGQERLTTMIENYTAKCPDTPIVLLGYSEGAIITMNTLCGTSYPGDATYGTALSSEYATNIIATIIYGDETRVPEQSYDLGTCSVGQGTLPRQNPDGCAAFAPNIQSYCDEPDPQCCGGDDQSVHYTYPATYNGDATQFVVDQYNAWTG